MLVDYIGSVYSSSGYGGAARRYIAALLSAGVRLRIHGLRFGELDDLVATRYPNLWALDPDSGFADPHEPPAVRIVHQNPAINRMSALRFVSALSGDRVPTVLLTVWEVDKLPTCAVEACNSFDAVFVPTQWNARCFEASGVARPIRVFGHPWSEEFDGEIDDGDAEGDERVVFYWIGAWRERKNPLGVVRAFLHAFGKDDPVRLVLKTGGVAMDSVVGDVQATVRAANLGGNKPEILVVCEDWPEERIEELHHRGDCFVSLARAEGWDLPLYEAALRGPALIASEIGGHEWMTRGDKLISGFHTRCLDVPAFGDPDSELFGARQIWAEPDLAEAAFLMREVVAAHPSYRSTRRACAEQRRREALHHLHVDAIGPQMREALEALTRGATPR